MADVFIFILGVLFLTESVVGYTQFGCDFNDENYTVDTAFTGNNEEPVWGGEIHADIHRNGFLNFSRKLDEIHNKVLGNFTFDTLDNFVQFYDSYKKAEKENNFKPNDFYKQYKEPYRPDADEAGFIIRMVTELAKEYPDVASKVFLSTCSSHIPTDVIAQLYTNKLTDDLPIDYFHVNIAGILNFTLDGKGGYKDGYVFLNPKRIQIMFKKDYAGPCYAEHYESGFVDKGNTGNELYYRTDLSNRYMLAASLKVINGSQVGSQENYEHLCYIGKPYCSFLQTTSKPHLTRPNHAMIRYKTNGDTKAALEANFIYNPNEEKVNTNITVWTSGEDSQPKINEISDRISDLLLEELSEELGVPISKMNDTIRKLQIIKKDDIFLMELYGIDGYYNNGPRNQANKAMTPLGRFIPNLKKDSKDSGMKKNNDITLQEKMNLIVRFNLLPYYQRKK